MHATAAEVRNDAGDTVNLGLSDIVLNSEAQGGMPPGTSTR